MCWAALCRLWLLLMQAVPHRPGTQLDIRLVLRTCTPLLQSRLVGQLPSAGGNACDCCGSIWRQRSDHQRCHSCRLSVAAWGCADPAGRALLQRSMRPAAGMGCAARSASAGASAWQGRFPYCSGTCSAWVSDSFRAARGTAVARVAAAGRVGPSAVGSLGSRSTGQRAACQGKQGGSPGLRGLGLLDHSRRL